jgi:hypothetical protein
MQTAEQASLLRQLRWVLALFMAGLVVSGLTAFPLQWELDQLAQFLGWEKLAPTQVDGGFGWWLLTVRDGLRESYKEYPWLAYGTDWLAFAHLIIAVFFVGAYRDPVRNIWIFQAGLIACVLVLPLALLCGPLRHIPFGWRLIDCSFGIFGAIPLLYCLRIARKLEQMPSA